MARPELEVAGAEQLRARDRDGADLERGEHDRMPLGRLADEHEHAVALGDALPSQERGPARRAVEDLGVAEIAAGAVGRDEGDRRPLEPLDDVAREVEAVRVRSRRAPWTMISFRWSSVPPNSRRPRPGGTAAAVPGAGRRMPERRAGRRARVPVRRPSGGTSIGGAVPRPPGRARRGSGRVGGRDPRPPRRGRRALRRADGDRVQARSAAGAVCEGYVRDLAALRALAFPSSAAARCRATWPGGSRWSGTARRSRSTACGSSRATSSSATTTGSSSCRPPSRRTSSRRRGEGGEGGRVPRRGRRRPAAERGVRALRRAVTAGGAMARFRWLAPCGRNVTLSARSAHHACEFRG